MQKIVNVIETISLLVLAVSNYIFSTKFQKVIITHRKNIERSVAGKFMTGIMWRVFEKSAIFFPVNNFPGHDLTGHNIPE